MMKLSLMNRFMETVDKEYRSPLAEAVASPWEHDPGTVRFWRASANFVCVVRRGGEKYFLRFNEVGERKVSWLNDEVKILNHLLAQGLPVSAPVLSRNGNYVELVTTELGTFAAVLFSGLKGGELELESMDDRHLALWGAAMGRLHRELKTLTPQFAPNRPSWESILDFAGGLAGESASEVRRELVEVFDELSSLPRDAGNYGLIHFDFESDNLCWDGDTVSALDFDDCARLWYAADIAYALRDLFKGGPVNLGDQRLLAFVKGYRSEEAIDDTMLQHLPLFMRLHRLFFIARLQRAVDIADKSAVPEWMQRLCDKLDRGVAQYIEDIRSGEVTVR